MSAFSVDLKQHLQPNSFLSLLSEAADDEETTKLRLLAVEEVFLEKVEEQILFPYILYLNQTGRTLKYIINRANALNYTKPVIQEVDWKNEKLTIEEEAQIEPGDYIGVRFSAIKWAFSEIVEPALQEGKKAYSQIKESMRISEMEPISFYSKEGFMLVSLPGQWQLYKYNLRDIEPTVGDKIALQASLCDREEAVYASHPTKKSDLNLSEYMDEPLAQGNPAVFSFFFTDAYDPQSAAVPVAKRELMSALHSK